MHLFFFLLGIAFTILFTVEVLRLNSAHGFGFNMKNVPTTVEIAVNISANDVLKINN